MLNLAINNPMSSTSVYKHLGIISHSKSSFEERLKSLLIKLDTAIDLIKKFWLHLSR